MPGDALTAALCPFADPGSMYWVLGTDYDTFAVVYSCSEVANAVVPYSK